MVASGRDAPLMTSNGRTAVTPSPARRSTEPTTPTTRAPQRTTHGHAVGRRVTPISGWCFPLPLTGAHCA